MTALGPPIVDHPTTALGGHTCAKTMRTLTLDYAGLISALHNYPNRCKELRIVTNPASQQQDVTELSTSCTMGALDEGSPNALTLTKCQDHREFAERAGAQRAEARFRRSLVIAIH